MSTALRGIRTWRPTRMWGIWPADNRRRRVLTLTRQITANSATVRKSAEPSAGSGVRLEAALPGLVARRRTHSGMASRPTPPTADDGLATTSSGTGLTGLGWPLPWALSASLPMGPTDEGNCSRDIRGCYTKWVRRKSPQPRRSEARLRG